MKPMALAKLPQVPRQQPSRDRRNDRKHGSHDGKAFLRLVRSRGQTDQGHDKQSYSGKNAFKSMSHDDLRFAEISVARMAVRFIRSSASGQACSTGDQRVKLIQVVVAESITDPTTRK